MDEEYLRFNEEGIAEVNPMASYNAQQAFIDNYRNAQAEKTAQIGEQAHALGSDLEAQYGGLHGPSEYWKSRYQTPQTESVLASLRSANQAQALNALMQQDLDREKEKYNQAYKNYQKRAASRRGYTGYYGNNGGGGGDPTDPTTPDGLELNTNAGGNSDMTISLNPNKGQVGKRDYDPTTGKTFYINQDGTKTNLYNLTGAAEMKAESYRLAGKYPNGTPINTEGATYTDPQTGFTYMTAGGRMYQIDESAIPAEKEIVSEGQGSW